MLVAQLCLLYLYTVRSSSYLSILQIVMTTVIVIACIEVLLNTNYIILYYYADKGCLYNLDYGLDYGLDYELDYGEQHSLCWL